MKGLFLAGLSFAVVYAGSVMGEPTRSEVIQQMDDYYQAQFADLELTNKGMFGTSRIESSDIRNHGRQGGDPGYSAKEWSTAVTIWGNRGKPLDAQKMERRYSRLPNRSAATDRMEVGDAEELESFVRNSAKKFSARLKKPTSLELGTRYFEARPILLSNRKCLSCHSSSRLNDPIAVIVYSVSPAAAPKSPPP